MSEITVVCNICCARFPNYDEFKEHWMKKHYVAYAWHHHPFQLYHPEGFGEQEEKKIQQWMKRGFLPIEDSEFTTNHDKEVEE